MERLQTIAGKGLEGVLNGVTYFAGNESQIPPELWEKDAENDVTRLKEAGYTVVIVASESAILGMFGVRDALRAESKQLISDLHHLGIKNTIMLTGDHAKTAKKSSR